MPVEFLGDEQAAAYGRFAASPSAAELGRLCLLDDADRSLIARHRGAAFRLGFALQLVTVRSVGAFLDDPLDVPVVVVDFVAEQLGIADPSCVKGYLERRSTRFEHGAEISASEGYRNFADGVAALRVWMAGLAWTTGDGPGLIFDSAVGWLRGQRVLLPGVSTLVRLVAGERDAASQRLFLTMAQLLTAEQANALDRLLEVPAGSRQSGLEDLRTGPGIASGLGMVKALHRVSEISGLGVGGVDLAEVPVRRIGELARYGLAAKAPALRRHPTGRRRATLLATARWLHIRAVDDALDLLDDLMTTDLLARAERESGKEKSRRYPRLSKDAG
ncbi:MAG: DUF4158 domain-containing protein, partial [Actinomycetota bacterium]|nr:DUF4158 domain-containing protein [Actinomycetota bacterium]